MAAVRCNVQQHGYDALRHAAEWLKADKEAVLAAVQQNGWALHFAASALKADKEVVVAAVQQNAAAEGCSSRLQQYGEALQHAAAALKANKAVVMAEVQQSGYDALQHAAKALQDDQELMANGGGGGRGGYPGGLWSKIPQPVVIQTSPSKARGFCRPGTPAARTPDAPGRSVATRAGFGRWPVSKSSYAC